MQKFLEATGENRDAAVENALKQLGLERDDVSVEVLEIGKKGLSGYRRNAGTRARNLRSTGHSGGKAGG